METPKETRFDATAVYRVRYTVDNEVCLARWSDIAQKWLLGHTRLGRIIAETNELEILGLVSEAELRKAGAIQDNQKSTIQHKFMD